MNTHKKPLMWTIAGSDSGAGAGIQADLLTCHDLGVYACTVITALTAQNSVEVKQIEPASAAIVRAQIDTLQADLAPQAIKLGMLYSGEIMREVKHYLLRHPGTPVVCDPVMLATSGAALLAPFVLQHFIQDLLPHVDILTPNLYEAEKLSGQTITTPEDIEAAAAQLCQYGAKSVLIKGGHKQGSHESDYCQDFWTNGNESCWLSGSRHPHVHRHGSGCSLASAIAACLAQGYTLMDALVIAKSYVSQGIRLAQQYGAGPGPIAHKGWPNAQADFAWMTDTAAAGSFRPHFPSCGPEPLGFYPIVDSVAWLEKLLPLGVKTLQLRIKNCAGSIEEEIHKGIALARRYQARLFINDYWQLAIEYGAYGVHLGQTDLNAADCNVIAKAGLRLGVSTHCYEELARAHALRPSYIAYGPIYETTAKIMPFTPRGIRRLKRVQALMSDYPVVAIGGINYERLADVKATGVDGIAVISAITQASDPMAATKQWLESI